MARKHIPYYEGKPGRKPTGLTRELIFPVMLSKNEWEYLSRLERQTKKAGRPLKKAQIIRARTFFAGWEKDLITMRRAQGANI